MEAEPEAEPESLTGFLHDQTLLLRDKRNIVYDSQRDQHGNLVKLGTFDTRTNSTIFAQKPTHATNTPNTTPTPPPKPSRPHRPPSPLNFIADQQDHCETAPEAYADVSFLLKATASALNIPQPQLKIYDPYYCNGAVKNHLAALGFDTVYNANEDFYQVLESGQLPDFDVIVTNPPYSGDHPLHLLRFCISSGKPWLALMPNWVYMKPYFDHTVRGMERGLVFVAPRKRYHYWTPRGRRVDVASGGSKAKSHGHTNASLGIRTSPFVSFWFGGGFPRGLVASVRAPPNCILSRQISGLPNGVLADEDSRKRRVHDRRRARDSFGGHQSRKKYRKQ